MTETLASLMKKRDGAQELKSVVRAMKVLAASSRVQYDRAVTALSDYFRTVELGLRVCLRQGRAWNGGGSKKAAAGSQHVGAVIFGSDNGLIGQFNEVVVDFAVEELRKRGNTTMLWAVSEQIRLRLIDTGLAVSGVFLLPNAVQGLAAFVGQVLLEIESMQRIYKDSTLYLFYNRPQANDAFKPVCERLLPLDDLWISRIAGTQWPTKECPEIIGNMEDTLQGLIHEYLFVSLYRACVESLAGENASRLASMQRAEKNIEELLEDVSLQFHCLRQSSIDEELFDVVAGFEAIRKTV
jgi:F-type H+-transporting ATPase subunit gamma